MRLFEDYINEARYDIYVQVADHDGIGVTNEELTELVKCCYQQVDDDYVIKNAKVKKLINWAKKRSSGVLYVYNKSGRLVTNQTTISYETTGNLKDSYNKAINRINDKFGNIIS